MSDERNILPNFRFYLLVNGIFEVPLKSVRAFTRENEYDYIQEGGQNDFVHLKRKPISKPYTLQVERYVPTDLSDPLSNGTELTLPLVLYVGKNNGGEMFFGRYYIFTGAVIMSKEYGQLDAEHSGLLTETSTIGYLRMFVITNPSDEAGKPAWTFNVGNEESGAMGNTSRLYSSNGGIIQNLMKTDSFKKLGDATMWGFKGTDKKGNGKSNRASSGTTELSKADMFAKRHKYDFALENNANSTGDRSASTKSAQNAKYSEKILGEELGIKELNHIEMARLARKWEFTPDGLYTGNSLMSSRKNESIIQLEKKDMRSKASKWEFDGKAKSGKGKRKAQNALVTDSVTAPDGSVVGLGLRELTQSEMEARSAHLDQIKVSEKKLDPRTGIKEETKEERIALASKWEFKDLDKEGNGKRRRQNAVSEGSGDDATTTGLGVVELSKAQFAHVAKKWEFKGAEKAGNGKKSARKPLKPEESLNDIIGNENRKKWEFTEDGGKEGNGAKSSRPPRVAEDDQTTLEGKAKAWEFKGTEKAGNGKKSAAKNSVEEKSKKDMETAEKLKKWEFNDYAKEGNGQKSSVPPKKAELSAEQMAVAEKHQKWEFDTAGTKAGNGAKSSIPPKKEEKSKSDMISKSNNARKVTQVSPKPKAKMWEFTDAESKDGNGQGSRVKPKVPETPKSAMINKAQKHVKMTIADFLSK